PTHPLPMQSGQCAQRQVSVIVPMGSPLESGHADGGAVLHYVRDIDEVRVWIQRLKCSWNDAVERRVEEENRVSLRAVAHENVAIHDANPTPCERVKLSRNDDARVLPIAYMSEGIRHRGSAPSC